MDKKKRKSNIFFKIFLDIALMATFILLMNSKIISMAFHEIAGVAIGVFFLVHKLLNLKWIKSVTKNIFGKKVTIETRIRYILDVLLLLGVYTIIVSGIFMSQVLFPQTATIDSTWKSIHTIVSYICIILIGLHVGLHWRWIMNGFSCMFKIHGENKIRKWLLRGAALALSVWGLVGAVLSGFFTNIGFASSTPNIPKIHDKNIDEERNPAPGTTTNNGATDSSTITNDNTGSTITNDNSDSTINNTDTTTDTVSLEKYLSGLTCTGCSKRCSLLYPQCSIGVKQQQQAIQEFEASSTTSSSTQGTAYTENGSNYLKLGDTIYTVSPISANVATSSVSTSSDTPTTADEQQGDTIQAPPGRDLPGLPTKTQATGVLDVILAFAPIVWFFGTIGYLLELLLGRKRGSVKTKEEKEIKTEE